MIVELLFLGVLVFVIFIIFIMYLTGEPLNHLLPRMKVEILYNKMGVEAAMENVLKRKYNKLDCPKKPGRIAVLTGGARGLGIDVVRYLLKHNVEVVIGCRNVDAGEKVLQGIRNEGIDTGKSRVFCLDLTKLESVREFAGKVKREYPAIHILINNAGIMLTPYEETDDGYESQFQVNYLGHFLLTHLLFENLRKGSTDSENARIVNVSSCAYELGDINFDDINFRKLYISGSAYSQSKLAQVLFSNYLNRMCLQNEIGIQAHSVHPGLVKTELFKHTYQQKIMPDWMIKYFWKKPHKGAVPIVHAALSPKLERNGGNYISNCQEVELTSRAKSLELQEKLFTFTKKILNIDKFGDCI